ncbi:uncharacterized protein [Procambarus clarkii]|uniref:uncharacterized protein n=1 Tax=Procambarus clarkii TaxID=6728 RepID=UPI003742FC81
MAKLLLLLLELCLMCHHTRGEQQPGTATTVTTQQPGTATTVTTQQPECFAPFTAVHLQCVLVLPDVLGSWYDMRNYCQDLRGELLKVDSDNFMYYLVKYIYDNGDYWIGGSDEGHEGDFLWTDGTSVKMGTPLWGDGVHDQIQDPMVGSVRIVFSWLGAIIFSFLIMTVISIIMLFVSKHKYKWNRIINYYCSTMLHGHTVTRYYSKLSRSVTQD